MAELIYSAIASLDGYVADEFVAGQPSQVFDYATIGSIRRRRPELPFRCF